MGKQKKKIFLLRGKEVAEFSLQVIISQEKEMTLQEQFIQNYNAALQQYSGIIFNDLRQKIIYRIEETPYKHIVEFEVNPLNCIEQYNNFSVVYIEAILNNVINFFEKENVLVSITLLANTNLYVIVNFDKNWQKTEIANSLV
jgi:uncharacterized protein YejL (UPF0352 family)